MFKKLMQTMFKDLKESMMAIIQQKGIINKETESIRKNQTNSKN